MTIESSIDRSVFDRSAINAETAEFNTKLEALLATQPQPQTIPPQITRDARESGTGTFGPIVLSESADERMIAGVPCRVLLPETVNGVSSPYSIMYFLDDAQNCKLSGNLGGTWENYSTTLNGSGYFEQDSSSRVTMCVLQMPDPAKL